MIKDLTIREVEFRGDVIESVEMDGVVYVPVKRICENLGLDRATQQEKIQADPKFSCRDISITARDGKSYEMVCLSTRDCHE